MAIILQETYHQTKKTIDKILPTQLISRFEQQTASSIDIFKNQMAYQQKMTTM